MISLDLLKEELNRIEDAMVLFGVTEETEEIPGQYMALYDIANALRWVIDPLANRSPFTIYLEETIASSEE